MTVAWPVVGVLSLLAAAAALAWALVLRRRLGAEALEDEHAPALAEERERRRRAEEAADRARKERDRILDSLTDGFFHLDARARFTLLNRTARELLGELDLTTDDLPGESIRDVLSPLRDAPGPVALAEVLEGREPRTHETYFETLDAWLELRAFPAPDGGVSVYLRDVTERKEAEIDLRESRERFRTLVEHAPEAVVVLETEAEEVVDFNHNVLELFERSPAEIRGSNPYQFSPPRQPDGRTSIEAARDYLQRTLEGESPVFEWVHLTGDGRAIDTEVRLVRLPARDRELVRGSITDITDRKRAERALRESEERFRALFEDDVAGNFVTDVGGHIRACNSAFARIFGFASVEQAVGTDVRELYPSAESRDELLDELREEETLEYVEVEARRVDGSTIHLVENVRGIFDEDGGRVELRGHLIDVTQQMELEDQLRRAQKLEAVGRLAGGIAHDFNNLLTTVTGHADLLLMNRDLTPGAGEDIRKIRRAADRAARLTGQLLAFSRRQVLQPDALNLNRVVENVTEMLGRIIGEDVEMRVEASDDLWEVEADAGQLEQVVMNLAVNARDAMPDGGLLTLATGTCRVAEGEVTDGEAGGDRPSGRYSYLEVRDTGEGIPEDIREKIFEPFFTTKEPDKGTGLGLAMVYGIVTQSKGHIRVDSDIDAGTSFRIYLPALASEAEEGEEATPARVVEEPTILVYQRDPVVRELVRRILRREGHSVLEAESTADACAFIREWSGQIHLFVTDALEDDDTPDLPSLLERERPECRVLETVTGEPVRDGELTEEWVHATLSTPFSPRDLGRRVASLLGLDRNRMRTRREAL